MEWDKDCADGDFLGNRFKYAGSPALDDFHSLQDGGGCV